MTSIEFTKDQFEALLKLVYMGEWLVNAHRLPDERIRIFEDLEGHLYSNANRYGLSDLVIIDPDSGKKYPSAELEFDETVQEYIDEYNAENFWNELSERLALRDAVRIHGEEKIVAMDPKERTTILSNLEEDYMNKFSVEGFDL